ncbi:MliC family protein [Caulobacter sp.]|uniref:MliC family protein n=1 Tax=Caulobacter sp. TaxID=78 RepID=UPI001B0BF6AF|nr:MliC family protein [Caulobacter sp.]MBO9544234.1 MliC family protein [Caulobacter sp.]
MKTIILALALATTLLAGCATDMPPATAKTEGRSVTYACDRGPDLTVVYAEDTASIIGSDGSAAVVLPQKPSASGVWYETPTHSIRGKGDEVTYTVGRMAPMTCKAR